MNTTCRTHLARLSAAALLGGAALVAGTATSAQSEPPEVVDDVRFDGTPVLDEGLSDHCGFPVTVANTGRRVRSTGPGGEANSSTGKGCSATRAGVSIAPGAGEEAFAAHSADG